MEKIESTFVTMATVTNSAELERVYKKLWDESAENLMPYHSTRIKVRMGREG